MTVSWNHTHNHTKNMLLGHDDGNGAQDIGQLKVTYHHNWFDRTPQRNPRVRFGEPVHVFNNYFVYNTDVGVACQANAGCVVEGNYFENVEEPVSNHYAGPTGRCVARNNVFVGESGQPDCSGTVQEPSSYYTYTVADPNSVKVGRDGRLRYRQGLTAHPWGCAPRPHLTPQKGGPGCTMQPGPPPFPPFPC